jgi:hypothetical protein
MGVGREVRRWGLARPKALTVELFGEVLSISCELILFDGNLSMNQKHKEKELYRKDG